MFVSASLQMTEVQHISQLPCLEYLMLTQNPVTTVLDYTTKVLSMFMDRASEVSAKIDSKYSFWFKQYLFIKYTIYTNTVLDMQDWA